MKSKVYEVISWIILVMGLTGGIVMGTTIPKLDFDNITGNYISSFNATVMFYCWVGTVLLFLIFFGIASILKYLEELGAGQKIIEEEPVVPIKIERPSAPLEQGDWICPKCGRVNKKYVGSCGCGYSKSQSDLWECPKCKVLTPFNENNECMNCHWKA